MADIDIKSVDHSVNVVNGDTNLTLQRVFKFDVVEDDFDGAGDVLKIADLPKGYAVKDVTMVVTNAFTSGGSATGQVKIYDGTNTVALGSATALANMALGSVVVYNAAGAAGCYKADTALELRYVNATAAFTAGTALLIVDLLPVDAMLNKG